MLHALAAAPAFDVIVPGHHPGRIAERIYFLHPPWHNFAATMTEEERAAFAAPSLWLGRLLADGVLILAGRTLGPVNTEAHLDRRGWQRPIGGRGRGRGAGTEPAVGPSLRWATATGTTTRTTRSPSE